MKKMNKKFLAGTAFAISTASALTLSGCCLPRFIKPTPTVYGPPEFFESQEQTTLEYEPEPPVYGPPEWFDTEDPEIKNDFSEETEILEDVYGPPEWFE